MGMKRDSITVHIEELVLTGFPTGSRHVIADAVQAELTRLIGEGGIGGEFASGGSYERLQGGSFTLPARIGSTASGDGIAARLHTTLSQEGGKHGTR